MGLNDLIRAYRYRRKIDKFSREIGNIYENESNIVCENQVYPGKTNCSIAFIVPEISKYSGGHTGILRLGTYLFHMGHSVDYIAINDVPVSKMEENAKTNFPNWKGRILSKEALKNNHYDVGIATKWNTCYHLIAYQSSFGLKAYFIQDFEPFFYPMSDHYILSLNTYKMGLKMISLGPWNAMMIKKFLPDRDVKYIEFPVELGLYEIERRELNLERPIRLAVYIKRDPKRAPFLLIEQLKFFKRQMDKRGIDVEINFFGIEKDIKLPLGNNLGKLNTEGLKNLYRKSHFGIVASLTNISYVNYEMIALGLPVIDFVDGSAPSFFSDDEMIFIEAHPQALFNKIKNYLETPEQLNILISKAQQKLKTITWESQAKRFAELLFERN
ncbi:MAG: glycosyltransferase family 1 protein [Proteobacteria bacterium]|nr:glycosyltransferase family 1 protein [Pseudomonadota bacterium]